MTETLSPAIPADLEEKVEAMLAEACRRKLSLATAESCTGGLIASLLTDVDGSGHAFDRGFVVYTEAAKCELLGLAQEEIDRFGVVSEEVARAMAEGAIDRSRADVALAVTGFAGPGGAGDEPGLVHFACARRDRVTALRAERFGDIGRGATRIACLRVAVDMIDTAVRG